jgi:hypothetical protein
MNDIFLLGKRAAWAAGLVFLAACGGSEKVAPTPKPVRKLASNFPWLTLQAEACRTNGRMQGPSRQPGTPEVEAVGRRTVRLEKVGDYLEFDSPASANTVLLRYSIPDGPQGGGMEGRIGLHVNGEFRQAIELSSRFSWVYGDFPGSNNPSEGNPRHVFDESHAIVAPIRPGDVVRLEKGAEAGVPWIEVDLIELEEISPPLTRPDNSLSILEFGATPDDETNDAAALVACMEAARQSGKSVWIPQGTFRLDGPRLPAAGVRLRGAGMWYSRLTGTTTMFDGTGEAIHVSDLAIFGEVDRRVDHLQTNAFNGNLGDGSVFERIWIEHMKCGFWTTYGTKRMVLRDSRVRNLKADGLNFCDGTVESVVERCHFRNTGDDALATWSARDGAGKPCRGNRFSAMSERKREIKPSQTVLGVRGRPRPRSYLTWRTGTSANRFQSNGIASTRSPAFVRNQLDLVLLPSGSTLSRDHVVSVKPDHA